MSRISAKRLADEKSNARIGNTARNLKQVPEKKMAKIRVAITPKTMIMCSCIDCSPADSLVEKREEPKIKNSQAKAKELPTIPTAKEKSTTILSFSCFLTMDACCLLKFILLLSDDLR